MKSTSDSWGTERFLIPFFISFFGVDKLGCQGNDLDGVEIGDEIEQARSPFSVNLNFGESSFRSLMRTRSTTLSKMTRLCAFLWSERLGESVVAMNGDWKETPVMGVRGT